MSRGFGSTFGSAATGEQIILNTSFTITGGYSFSCWVYVNTSGENTFGLVINSGATPQVLALRLAGSTTAWLTTTPWSTTRGTWTYTSPIGAGVWYHICQTYDGSSTANNPTVYINGNTVSVTLSTTPAGSFGTVLSAFSIGNAGTTNFDGMIAHAAIWNNKVLKAGDALSLAQGVNPLLIAPDSLVMYCPLDGINNPEFDFVKGNTSSIAGTRLGKSDPPVQPLSRIRSSFHSYDVKKLFQSAWAVPVNFPQQGYGT